MDVLAVIPARYGSTRFPGKPLHPIAGKPLIQWVIEKTKQSKRISRVIVATDDKRIQEAVQGFNAECVMTASELPSGTDRIWAASSELPADIVINVQGDEPLITGELLDQLIAPLEEDKSLQMSTLATSLSAEELENPNVVKVVLNQQSEGIYFSRYPIPYSREKAPENPVACLKHIGLYAYRKSFLKEFCEAPQAELEINESLEQLRALYLGARIKVVVVGHQAQGVDTLDDAKKVEKILLQKG